MADDRIETIEAKVAYLEDANDTLSKEVAAQLRKIEQLESRLTVLTERVGEMNPGPAAEPRGDEPPPHY